MLRYVVLRVIEYTKRPLIVLGMVLCLTPVLSTGLVLDQKLVNAPMWDEWVKSYSIVEKTVRGTISFDDIFRQDGPSRYVFTNLATFVSARYFDWNLKLLGWTHYLMLIVSYCLLLSIYHRFHPKSTLIAAVPFAFLLFDLRQMQALTWTFQGYMYYLLFFFLLGLWLLTRPSASWRELIGAWAISTSAVYTYPTGWAFAPIYLIGLWFWGYRKWKYFVFWVIMNGIIYAIYFSGYEFRSTEQGQKSLADIIAFFVLYLVSPLLSGEMPAGGVEYVIFAASVLMFLVGVVYSVFRLNERKELVTSLALGAFSVAAAVFTAQARSGSLYHEDIALSSRYVVHSIPYWICLAAITVPVIQDALKSQKTVDRIVATGYFIIIVPLIWMFVNNSAWTRALGRNDAIPSKSYEDELLAFQLQDNKDYDNYVSKTMYSREKRNEILEFMIEHDLGVFHDSSQVISLRFIPLSNLTSTTRASFVSTISGKTIYPEGGLSQSAPNIAEQTMILPDAVDIDFLTTATIITPLSYSPSNHQRDGVMFFLTVTTSDNSVDCYQVIVDPSEGVDEAPIILDLSEYRGQKITIQYETQIRENQFFDFSTWLDPRISLSDNPNFSQDLGMWEACESPILDS